MSKKQKLTKEQKDAIHAVVKKYIPGWGQRNPAKVLATIMGTPPAILATGAFAADAVMTGGVLSFACLAFTALALELECGAYKNTSRQGFDASDTIFSTFQCMENLLSESFQAVARAQPADRAKRQAEFEALRAEITADREVLSPVYRVFENPEGIETDKYVFCLEEPGEHSVEGTNATVMSDGVYDTLEADQPVPMHSKPKRAIKLGK